MATAIIQLGRYGDIINILPMAKIIAEQEDELPTIFVQHGFESILDGVSYAKSGVISEVEIPVPKIAEALKSRFDRVLVPQVCGPGISYERQCDSFTKEAWRLAGMLPYWGSRPVFDKRNASREKSLIDRFIDKEKVNVLVNLSGASSPYPHAEYVWNDLRMRYGKWLNLINLAGVRASRFYDLVGLFENASLLITIDTGTLHLASACDIPTIALLADKPGLWHGAIPPGHVDFSLRYSESLSRVHDLHSFILGMMDSDGERAHVFCDFMGSGDALRRNSLASEIRSDFYARRSISPVPVIEEQMPRIWEKDGGGRRLIYIKDMINFGFRFGCKTILLTNTDTCLSPSFMSDFDLIDCTDPSWGSRRDFDRLDRPLIDQEIKEGHDYCGTDLFVIPFGWWQKNKSRMPDMLCGAEGWDCCLSELMRSTGGIKLFFNSCYHERHDSFWEQPSNRYSLPSQLHNIALAKKFLTENGIDFTKRGFK